MSAPPRRFARGAGSAAKVHIVGRTTWYECSAESTGKRALVISPATHMVRKTHFKYRTSGLSREGVKAALAAAAEQAAYELERRLRPEAAALYANLDARPTPEQLATARERLLTSCKHADTQWLLTDAEATDAPVSRPNNPAEFEVYVRALSAAYRQKIRETASTKKKKFPRDEKKRLRREADAMLVNNLVGLCHLRMAVQEHCPEHRVVAAATIGLPIA